LVVISALVGNFRFDFAHVSSRIQDARRPFLLPRVNALRLNMLALLSSVGDLGLSLPDGRVLD
jgi:hypothetical protein